MDRRDHVGVVRWRVAELAAGDVEPDQLVLVPHGEVHRRPRRFHPIVAAEDGDEPDRHVVPFSQRVRPTFEHRLKGLVPVQPSRPVQEVRREPQLRQTDVVERKVLDRLPRDPPNRVVGTDGVLRDGERLEGFLQPVDR